MWVTVVWLGQTESLAVRPGFIPTALYWIFGAHFLWRDTLLSLDIVGRALVLPQSNVIDFVDFPWKTLPSLRSGWGVGWGGKVKGTGGGEGVGNRFGM